MRATAIFAEFCSLNNSMGFIFSFSDKDDKIPQSLALNICLTNLKDTQG